MSGIIYYKKRKKRNRYWVAISLIPLLIVIITVAFVLLKPKGKLQIALDSYSNGDYGAALEKFTDLANANNSHAQLFLGQMYFEGQGVQVDYASAARLFAKASEQDNPRAMHSLAVCYMTGMGVERDVRKALQLEIKAASIKQKYSEKTFIVDTYIGKNFINSIYNQRRNNIRAQNVVRAFTEDFKKDTSQNENPSNTKTALEAYINSSREGKPEAAYLMGLIYSDGQEMDPNMEEAEKWFRESAHSGNVSAQMILGKIYLAGNGVLQDFAEAFYWFKKAAENGSKDALFMLGNLYSIGYGVEADYSKAAIHYAMAIELNHSLAKCYLADLFGKGYGVFKNTDMARILCQEGFKETSNTICYDIWEANNLAMTNRDKPELF
jgi:TPR repeat protein